LRVTEVKIHDPSRYKNLALLSIIALVVYMCVVSWRLLSTASVTEFYFDVLAGVSVIWAAFVLWMLTHRNFGVYFNIYTFSLLYFIVPVITIVAYMGLRDARDDLIGLGEAYHLEVKDTSPRDVLVLRNMDKGLLYEDKQDQMIHFVHWDDVLSFTKDKTDMTKKPMACKWLNLWC
jgi:hypothetical protein